MTKSKKQLNHINIRFRNHLNDFKLGQSDSPKIWPKYLKNGSKLQHFAGMTPKLTDMTKNMSNNEQKISKTIENVAKMSTMTKNKV